MNKKRTVLRSSKGKKLLVVRDRKGKLNDVKTWERSSRQDQRKRSKSEKSKKHGFLTW